MDLTTHMVQKYKFNDRLKKAYHSAWTIWTILIVGILIRAVQYIYNRSLWLDEMMLTHNIIDRSFHGLLQPLDLNQGAPIGFLFLEKLAVLTFGPNAYALRLFPFLSGVIALILFYKVCLSYIKKDVIPVCLLLFSFCIPLIRYSSEVKQYSTDVLIALILYLAADPFFSKEKGNLKYIIFGIIGALSVWFSHSSVFVLAGIGTVLFIMYLYSGDWRAAIKLAGVYLFWIISFALIYYVSLRYLTSNKVLTGYWKHYFAQILPTSISAIRGDFDYFYFNVFSYIFGNKIYLIAGFLFFMGFGAIFIEKNVKLAAAISPVVFALIASALGKYPFSGRLILFLAPALILITSVGAISLISKYSGNMAVLILALFLTFFLFPFYNAYKTIAKPIKIEEIKPVMQYISKNSKKDDIIYVYYGAKIAFGFYSEKYNLHHMKCIVGSWDGRNNLKILSKEIEKLKGHKRVWVLFSHVWKGNGINEEKFFLFKLNNIGKCIDSYHEKGASAYLYVLGDKTTG